MLPITLIGLEMGNSSILNSKTSPLIIFNFLVTDVFLIFLLIADQFNPQI